MRKFVFFFLFCIATAFWLYGCGGARRGGDSLLGGTRRAITTIVVHHTAGVASNDIKQVTAEISRLHRRKFRKMGKSAGLHIAYHYLITPNGKVWKVRDPDDVGHHAGNWRVNKHSVAVCLAGDFSKHRPTKAQVASLDALVRQLQKERRIRNVIPHSHCRATLCCGEYLKREVRKLSWGKHF
ncbi:MAG: peptidoglycan recognition family protein [Candidatus Kaiserbacteria bacterium]|nr:peptidoglycan recognition family protein [Candidatus Kaiserbacteria bacterium]